MNQNYSFSIHLANDSGIDSRKKAKNSQGIGVANLLESESEFRFFWNRHSPSLVVKCHELQIQLRDAVVQDEVGEGELVELCQDRRGAD